MFDETLALENRMTFWCAGLQRTGDRPLTKEEMEALDREAQQLRVRGIAMCCVVPISLLLIIALLREAQARNEVIPVGVTLLSVSLFLILAGIPVEILLAMRWMGRSQSLWADIREGSIWLFKGRLDEVFPMDATQKALLAAQLLHLDGEEIQWIELLPISRRVWRVNGIAPRAWLRASASEVALTPEFAAIAAQWLEPLGRNEEGVVYGGQRELSSSERIELRRHIRRMWTRPLSASLPIFILLCYELVRYLQQNHTLQSDQFSRVALLGIGVLFFATLLTFRIRQAQRFREDMETGYVAIRRVVESETKASEPEIEFLPASGMLWTRAGEPAAWRRSEI
ncbi:MAG TPA: hypothetical protein VKU00_32465 [Chthonomonadaceae bacterium]|nr:hypothetical protein [Chthonomonadaceae bacterium]